ncbi:phage protease [Propionivibrio sp.]|uniref:phage protease n=1 Tax=Propionivibrio sp. TaxID=2212460 RepID=UPI003BF44A9B
MPSQTRPALAIAALSVELSLADGQPPKEFRLFPAGHFRAADGSGRPSSPASGWLMNAASAQRLITAASARQNDYLLDYEHATLSAAKSGQKAIAAGWFKQLEWREGDGLYVIEPRFTAAAATHIAALEYRYLSPVFAWDRDNGEVLAFYHAGLTNDPGLDGLTDFSALGALFPETHLLKDSDMKVLLAALGLSETATEDQGLAALAAIKAQHDTSITSLRSQKPDPSAYVDIQTFSAVQGELATLKASARAADVEALVAGGLSDGRILPAAEAWARQYGASDVAGLRTFLDKAPKVAALQGMQTGGKPPADTGADALNDDELALCRAFGNTPADFAKTRKGE